MDGMEEKLGALLSDPEAMARFRQLASALSGGMGGFPGEMFGGGESRSAPPELDSGLAELMGKLLRAYGTESEAMQLVASLKPWLQPQRAAKLDKAMRIAHFARAARAVLPELMHKMTAALAGVAVKNIQLAVFL